MNHVFKNDIPIALSYNDVLLVPQYSEIDSRSNINLETNLSPLHKLKIPLISINMDTVTGVEMAIAMGKLGGLGILPRFDSEDIQAGKVSKVKKAIDATRELKNRFPNLTIISGVIATYEGAKALFEAGADSVRVGVGNGTICTTRIQTGFGVSQITALLEVARAAREFGKTLLADGGTENSGDIVKGLAIGASAIISGSQLAGTDEAPGEIVMVNEEKFKKYNASTSLEEKLKHIGNDSTDKGNSYTKHIEGVEALIRYKGSVADVVERLMAGVRSGFSYCGARNINELWEKAEFIRITHTGLHENGVHNVHQIG